ncbi:MAG: hypothetical protein CL778_01545 [Chloroflexi bacterium]|nr:hypothetical protein [Chloroflexota bacterium]
MNIHIIGIGHTGSKISEELCSAGHKINAIDTDKKSFTKLPSELIDNKYIKPIMGNGNSKDTINSLRIINSDIVIICTGKDTLNCLIAQKISILANIDKEKIIILIKDFYIGNFYRSLGFSIFNKIDSISDPVLKLIKNRNI